jgi:predicted transcriptional regulator
MNNEGAPAGQNVAELTADVISAYVSNNSAADASSPSVHRTQIASSSVSLAGVRLQWSRRTHGGVDACQSSRAVGREWRGYRLCELRGTGCGA